MDPERPIEKLLRQAARQRLDAAGGDFQLHPVNRKLLQAEAARQFGPEGTPKRLPFLVRFWPRLALGTAASALVVLAIFWAAQTPRSPKEQLLAKNEPVAAAEPAPPLPLSHLQKDKTVSEKSPTPSTARLSEEERPVATAAPGSGPAIAHPYQSLALASNQEPLTIKAESSGVVAPAKEGLVASNLRTDVSQAAQGNVQRFGARTPVLAAQSKALPAPSFNGGAALPSQEYVRTSLPGPSGIAEDPAAGVMVSFKLQQAGNELQVIDRDGSVYTGSLQPGFSDAAVADRKLALRATQPAPTDALATRTQAPAEFAYPFQVTGTNLSLKQKVVFTGTLLAGSTSSVAGNAPSNAVGGSGQRLRPLPLLNSRVSGKVLVGENPAREINAVPSK